MEKRNDNCRIKKLKIYMKAFRYFMLVVMMVTSLSMNAGTFNCEGTGFSLSLNCSSVYVPANYLRVAGRTYRFVYDNKPIRLSTDVEEARLYDVITLIRAGYMFSYAGKGGHGASGRIVEKMIYSVDDGEWQALSSEPFYDTQSGTIVTDGFSDVHVPVKTCQIRLSDIVDESLFGEKDYCTVRFKVYINVEVSTRSDRCTNPSKRICTETVTLKVYKCDGGLIRVGDEYHSSTSTEDKIYHIYAEDDGNGLRISNEEGPTAYKNESQSWLWNVWDKSQEKSCVVGEVKKKEMSQYDYGVNVSYRRVASFI